MQKHFITILILVAPYGLSFAQERKITGRVVDSNRKGIKDVNIVLAETTTGTVSNQLGYFELTFDPSMVKSLVASHIGFTTSEIQIPAEDRFVFTLEKAVARIRGLNLAAFPKEARLWGGPADLIPQQVDEFKATESEATVPGGIDNFLTYIGNKLSGEVGELSQEGIGISFTIDATGKATAVSVSDTTKLKQAVAGRIFADMPAWNPATQRQRNVPQHFFLPVYRTAIPAVIPVDSKQKMDVSPNTTVPPTGAGSGPIRTGYFAMGLGLASPTGVFAEANLQDKHSGYAESGLAVNFTLSKPGKRGKAFGWIMELNYTSMGMNGEPFRAYLQSNIGGGWTDVTDNWKWLKFYYGWKLSFQTKDNAVAIEPYVLGGLQYLFARDELYRGSGGSDLIHLKYFYDATLALTYQIGVHFRIPADRGGLFAGVSFSGSGPNLDVKFEGTSTFIGTAKGGSASYSQDMYYLQLRLGYAFRLSDRKSG